MLRRDDDSVLRVALDLEVSGKRKRGRPKKTWKRKQRGLFRRKRMPGIEQSGETKCVQLQKE